MDFRGRQGRRTNVREGGAPIARYKPIDTGQGFIAVDLASQLLPGAFEHALNYLLDREIDLSGLDARYANDETGAPRDCLPCTQRERCLRTPDKTRTRHVAFFQGCTAGRPESFTARMQRAIDSPRGRALYGRRIGIVVPVFANLRHDEKLAHHGYAQ